jgi:peptidoglycan/xylan/chitin deacetylase (PgdA/CDA1 family)
MMAGKPPTRAKVGLIFDDGFARSTLATAKLFEEFHLPAVFAVIAEPKDFAPTFIKGDFAMWNELQSRGHIIQPHGYTHAKLTELPHQQAVAQIERCLATFSEKLDRFDPKRAVYYYTYNCGSSRLNEFLLPRVHAIRQDGSGFLSQRDIESRVWHSTAIGPHDPGDELLQLLDRAADQRPHTFLFTLHGTDGEAWGAIALDKLRRVLDRIVTEEAFEYWPVGQ